MVEINGQSFENWEQAQAYIEEQKQAEAKAKADAEQNERLVRIREYLNDRLNVATVKTDDGTYLVCTIAEDERRGIYPNAVAEDIFGDQFDVYDTSVVINYEISKIGKPTNAVKDFIAEHHAFGKQCREQWNDVEIGGVVYSTVFLQDFCYNSDTMKNNTNTEKNEKTPNAGGYSHRSLNNGVHVVTCNGVEDMLKFFEDLAHGNFKR